MTSVTFVNARLVDKKGTYTVEIRDGRITSIEVSDNSASSPNSVDLQGKHFLSYSMSDAHTHFTAWTLNLTRVDISAAQSAQAAVEMMVEAASNDPESTAPLVGRDYRVGKWKDIEGMTRQALDAVSPNRPVALISGDLHSIWLSTAAFVHCGVDPEGQPGVLFEKPAFDALGVLNDLNEEALFPLIMASAKAAAATGCTHIVDLEMKHNIPNWLGRVSKGFDLLRVDIGAYTEHLDLPDGCIARGLKSGDLISDGNDLLTMGPYKVITDGSLGARTAFCCAPYPGTNDHGLWIYPDADLATMLAYGTKHNLRLAVHAIGDEANHRTLATFAALSPPPLPGSSIEHAQMLSSSDFSTFGSLSLVASIQPAHLLDDIELLDRFWVGRTEKAFPYRSLVDGGATLRLGSDCPVAPLDPWGAQAAGVSRARVGGERWHPEQCLTNLEVYGGSTWNGKIALEVGDVADLCIIDQDPLTASAEGLRAMKVLGTLLGGRWTHRDGI